MPFVHPVREAWSKGKTAANGWISTGSALVAEVVAMQGYDAVTIDMQHGMGGFAETLAMLQAIRAANGPAPMVRVPSLEPAMISKVLDAGALGIICPLIDTAEEAKRLVSYVRYQPLGERSSGPTRAMLLYPDYVTVTNREILVFAMIETQAALDNLESIVRTPGLDGVYIGPSDLSLGLSKGTLAPGFDRTEPEMVAAIKTIIAAAQAAGIKVCLHCGSSEYAAKAVGWGINLVTLLNDVRMLAGAAAASVKRFHELSAETPS